MSRDPLARVTDILQAIERCREHLRALDDGDGDSVLSSMATDAIERNLQIIGEAVTHLPDATTSRHPEVPWPRIRGFRNILVHQYFGVDAATVRDVIDNHLPVLEESLRQDLPGE
ncbi:DUF86 domain-containing protein [Actinomyces sp. B33]|uniref:HepT-like ribonuclease domain-containing protein n=1 Tax=Actinomyces sp. B33 TaxID=2942131 RepID=UPI002340DD2D|nr:HepT-like ribonuclease domain-containing protein [Actinomyces sp. B33]MDC4232280.1 DUF86 domain-containing protein [Actinomyces sp. B33]